MSESSSSPSQYRSIGIILAVGSGLLIGTSFVFKKKGLLRSQAGHAAGEGVAYLKSPMWWTGMIMMICGETCNFGAYAFVEAIVVTPLGALSVVISAILSHIILKEKLTLFGWVGCAQCILGAILISVNAPGEQSVSTIVEFKKLFLAPGFLSYGGCCIAAALVIIFFVAPKYGTKSMVWYILVCSLIGGISVSCTQGLGACILTSIRGDNQFKNWFIYFLMIFVICTLLTEIYYLNVALALFNTVTPTYYVLFTFFTLVTSVILYQGLKASASAIITIALSFLVICTGIFILQLSKVDPRHLTGIGRKTTILLQAAREKVRLPNSSELDSEKLLEATEEPGMDALAGRFSGVGGTVVRARRRTTIRASREGPARRCRADTSASAPVPTFAHRNRRSTSSRDIGSSDMDIERARRLQGLWHEEWLEEKRGAGEGTLVPTVSGDASARTDKKFDEWGPVDGLPAPIARTSLSAYISGNGNAPSATTNGHILSSGLASSPVGTTSDLHSTHSVRFSNYLGNLRGRFSRKSSAYSTEAPPSPRPEPQTVLTAPAPALIQTSSASLPSLHLPTPSLQMRSFMLRESSDNSRPMPILRIDTQEKRYPL
ncbi:hypothetical protein M0805_000747 [Coniferiporia weirii]|nr:hypothetical protein M0805_000747 [Coniferiporia weirii]